MITTKESHPLAWPDGWPRTLLRDRQMRRAWKDTLLQSADKLRKELHRSKALSFVISCNIPPAGNKFADVPPPMDAGVAVWFSRERPDDYSWQEVLGIYSPSPGEQEVRIAFKEKAARYHPDNLSTGDIEIYRRYDEARKKALDFVARKTGANYQQVIAVDLFTEVRWNMRAIERSLAYIRGLEHCGSAAILERAYEGFAALPEVVREHQHATITA